MIWNSLKTGFAQVWANKRLILVFYLANLFFGLLLMLPLRAMLSDFIGNSEMGAKLGGPLDMDFLFEFFKHSGEVVPALTGLLLIVPIANWLFTLFLSGGAFATFAADGKYQATFFWSNAAKYFGRFLRLTLWSVPVFAIFFCLQYLESGVERLIFGSDPYQNITYWGGWIKVGLRQLGFLLFGMALDYARIHTVLNDEQKMRVSLVQGLKFAFGNFLQTFGLAFLLLAVGAAALVVYNPVANSLSAPNAMIIFMLFIWQQIYMLFRMTLRLTTYSSQLDLYRRLIAGPESVPATSTGEQPMEGFAPAA
ncbi:MAG: hypothetical protein ONB46_18795 [candidate division KSB1 bacterium]|nr:hypothetical protein [candidate division KSB1 bacterium]MDZ7367930.1 hypothetical protein [candidate division KSB1 bacterium]MDZ7406503.1 hypothetical protein [candidate division KSB1 bacterium]